MGLPIDLYAAIWVIPKALWEPEPEPAPADPAGEDPGTSTDCAAATPSVGTATPDDQARKAAAPKLVFKGFTFDYDYQFHQWDSALIEPWTKCEDEEPPLKPKATIKVADVPEEIDTDETTRELAVDWSQDFNGIADDIDAPPQDSLPDPEADPA